MIVSKMAIYVYYHIVMCCYQGYFAPCLYLRPKDHFAADWHYFLHVHVHVSEGKESDITNLSRKKIK